MGKHETPAADHLIERRPEITRSGLETLDQFARDLAQLDTALDELGQQGDPALRRSVDAMRRSLLEFEPSVTLLGQVKAGKTALVNAMAGWSDLLPSDVNPWTSVVTSLHLTPYPQDTNSRAEFTFFGADEWDRLLRKGGRLGELADRSGAAEELQKIRDQIEQMREKSRQRLGRKFEMLLGQTHDYGYFDKNLIERYICLGDMFDDPESANQGRFADITKAADLYLHAPEIPVPLCLRDTPGVNDTFLMREQVTIQAIRDSRLCVVVLSAHQALTSVDMAVIRLISNLDARDVIIFVNRIDELPDPARQIPEIRDSIRATLTAQAGPADCAIVFGSAYWAGKVLANDIENMGDGSADALLNWAAKAMPNDGDEVSPARMIWDLSGIPTLYRAIGQRIVEGQGKDLLTQVARNGLNVASNLQVSSAITVSAAGALPDMIDPDAVMARMDDQMRAHQTRLQDDLSAIVAAYQARIDRAHDNFLDRATHSLIRHLEHYGEQPGWHYDPTGLRMLLRSAYNVFGTQARNAAQRHYDAAATEIAQIYGANFGALVNGFGIRAPTPPDLQAPVGLGQTIALDLKDGWWSGWWRRARGYKAFAEKFRAMIRGETDTILDELKNDQADLFVRAALAQMAGFIDEQRSLLAELAEKAAHGDDFGDILSSDEAAERHAALEETLRSLKKHAA